MKKYTVGSLFAGIGGICLGFKQAGAEVIWANEIDKYACITYEANFGDGYLVEGDIKAISPEEIPTIDILTAGFPCQAFSVAGYQKGFNDERGNLFFEIMRIIEKKTPRAFLLENVKNLVSHDNGNTFRVIQTSLENEGYHLKYKVLNSMEYGNIPQTRERIYIVGFKDLEDYNKFSFPMALPLTKTIHDLIDINDKKPAKYYYTNSSYYPMLKEIMHKKDTVYQLRRVYVRENKSNVCPTLTANMGGGGHNVPLIIDNYDIRKLTPRETFLMQGFPPNFILPSTVSDTHLYKQAGNSVTVPVIRRIAENMLRAMSVKDSKSDLKNKLQIDLFEAVGS